MDTITSHVPGTTRGPRGVIVALALALVAAALILFFRTNLAPADVSTSDAAPAISSVADPATSGGAACTLRRSTSGGVLAGFEAADRCDPAPSARTGGPIP